MGAWRAIQDQGVGPRIHVAQDSSQPAQAQHVIPDGNGHGLIDGADRGSPERVDACHAHHLPSRLTKSGSIKKGVILNAHRIGWGYGGRFRIWAQALGFMLPKILANLPKPNTSSPTAMATASAMAPIGDLLSAWMPAMRTTCPPA
ncbi:hypothetical protein [Pontibacter sp. G13]|uniref:hypothetical protein n=1 Tax=Pontibacter sp. G13 TaxID=3074898 RepID=UPI00288B019E|nr:hypothetical protein [Pontibacter sp. G13]WNJ19679.1 hypothetical protein RJD25_04285 [Pontibacter sp. G13]